MRTLLPDVVVGVDFGMTSTGVAYSAGPEWARPETIQNWSGNLRGMIADKVDTKIAYGENGDVVSWGFMVNQDFLSSDYRYEELFKLYLDPEFDDPHEDAPTLQEARTWFRDYLFCIHDAVNRHLDDTIPRYGDKRVEFRFSVPTTWKNPAMIAETEQLIQNAGFGRDNPLHTVEISLTEAEAAAVYASKQQYDVGDIFMVCDAGGGTTDVNILKVISSGVGQTELEPLSWVEGRAIGSTLIDYQVEKLVAERLRSVSLDLVQEPDLVARQVLRYGSRFESFKCSFGDEAMNLPTLRLDIPGIAPCTNLPLAHIENSQMVISKNELQCIFDAQVNKIISLIDDQINQLEQRRSGEHITYLVLSGGLGSSPYLQQRLKARYQAGTGGSVAAKSMQILRVPKPQLAVCHGLVLDRVQQIKQNRVVYKERFCRNSYGVVVRKPFDASAHVNQPTQIDPRDKRVWAVNQIDWFIVQGQKISVQEGIKQHYSLKVSEGQEKEIWQAQIVMSTLPAEQLPTSLSDPGAYRLCRVESHLPSTMKLKNRHWYNRGSRYLRADFDVQVLVGAADLKFQTLDKSGILSQSHDTIAVEWVATPRQARQLVIAELEGSEVHDMRSRGRRWRFRRV